MTVYIKEIFRIWESNAQREIQLDEGVRALDMIKDKIYIRKLSLKEKK